MAMRSVNRFQKRVRQQYNQNLINMGVTIPAGIYLGEVTQNNDPDYPDMRVKVHVFRLLPAIAPQNSTEVTDDEPELGSIWCQRMSPFAANSGDYSYGMMGPPPEPGNTVIVAYTGDYASGIILGVLPDLKKNQGLSTGQPAAETPEGINPATEPDNQGNQSAIPVVAGTAPDLLRDDPMRRPSQRFNPRNMSISAAGGNHVTVSPGDREDGTGAGVRMGTGRGAQLLMDDRSDTIYMNNASGNAYISMDTNGNVDIYCGGTFSVHAVGGFNFHTDNSFGLQADDGINMKSLGGSGVKIQAAGGNLDLSILNNVYITAQGGEIHALASSNILMTGANIHLNGRPTAESASPPAVAAQMGNTGVTQSVSGRVPEAEPWRGHTTYSRDADQTGNRSEYSTAPGAGVNPSRVGNEFPAIAENASEVVFWQDGVDRRISQELFDEVERIAREYGKTLKITKGYVIPSRAGGTSNADNSLHMDGRAVDVIHGDGNRPEILRDEVLQLIDLAESGGVIGGIGVYNDRRPDAGFANELHFDLGRQRIWGECADGSLQYECLPTAIQDGASELGYDPEIPAEDASVANSDTSPTRELTNAEVDQILSGEDPLTARQSAEEYLGRPMSDEEWNNLVAATVAESSPNNPREQAAVMGVILNRARSPSYPDNIVDVLQQPLQFQAVTGTPSNPTPSSNFTNPANSQVASTIDGVNNYLSGIPQNWYNFTSNNPAAYGPGTNIDFMYDMRNNGGNQVIGGTVFGNAN